MSGLSGTSFEQFMSVCKEYLEGDDSLSVSKIKQRFPRFANGLEEQLEGLSIALQVPNPRVGEVVSQYVLGEPIASGGMGQVFRAQHLVDGRPYAVKVLSLSDSNKGSRTERFMLETSALTQLHHDFIVPVVDHGVHTGWAWLAMPFIDGISLDAILFGAGPAVSAETKVPNSIQLSDFFEDENEYRWIAKRGSEIASGLAEAHAKSIIHRDIKPGNLILDRNGKIWIVDFGLVKFLNSEYDLSISGDMIGTPRYMPPEQFRGFADQRSDIYSLGITLWEMVCKRKANGSAASHFKSWKSSTVPAVQDVAPQVPIELAEVIDKACAGDPSSRFASATEFARALNAASNGKRSVFAKRNVSTNSTPALTKPFAVTASLLLVAFTASYTFQAARHNDSSRLAVVGQTQDEYRVNENTTIVGKVAAPDTGEWTLSGPDASKFSLDPVTHTLTFRVPPDFEAPSSAQRDNHYRISLYHSHEDAPNSADVRQLQIFVTDADEPVELLNVERTDRHSITVLEGQLTLPLQSLGPVDPENRQWAARIAGGQDASSFAIFDQRLVLLDLEQREASYDVVIEFHDHLGVTDLAISYDSFSKSMLLGDIGNRKTAMLSPHSSELDPRYVRAMNCTDGREVKLFKVNDKSVELWKISLSQGLRATNAQLLQSDCGLPNGIQAVASRDGVNFLLFGMLEFPTVNATPRVSYGGCYVSRAVLDANGVFQIEKPEQFLSNGADIVGAEFVSERLVALQTRERSRMRLIDPETLASAGIIKVSTPYDVRGWTVVDRPLTKTIATRLNLSVRVEPAAVTVFEHPDFAGAKVPLEVGVYDYEQILNWSVGNDAISSLAIEEGYAVRVAEDNDGYGATQTFQTSSSWLGDFDDKISWIEIFRKHNTEEQ